MSDTPKSDMLCERCSLLSFDDGAIGGQEVIGGDGVARLSFPESKVETRRRLWTIEIFWNPNCRLVRLDWKLDEILPDMPHLSRSAQLGCAFCQVLRKSLEERLAEYTKSQSIDDGSLNLVAYLSLLHQGEGEVVEGLMIEAIYNQGSLDRRSEVIEIFFPIEGNSTCSEWLQAEPELSPSYLDPRNIDKIHELLNHCASTCHPGPSSSFMPTRLIDVGQDASAVPRLVLSSGIRKDQEIKYAALSYCWGNAKDAALQFKTEKESLGRRYVGLPIELMTPTTNDAITLTKAIGLRYVWIDALCIVQDDEDDWSRESSRMNLVYAHAFVTFCNLNSDSCHETFLERVPAIEIPFQSTIRRAIKGSYLIRLRSRTGHYLDRGYYALDMALSKWDKRCWTFQEKEMSTRLLMFGSLRIHLACAKSKWSEGDEAPSDRSESTVGVSEMITRFKDKRISSTELYEYWDWLVFQYGHRSVTFDKDRLPAIAGLARIIGEALHDQYLAGLWKGDFHYGLTWYSVGGMLSRGLEARIRDIKERNYVAPSWSWAACPGVGFMTRHSANMIKESIIVDVNTDTSSDDPYGQVSGGFLRIRGKRARMPDWLPKDKCHEWSCHWTHFLTDTFDDIIHVITDWLHKDEEAGLENLVVMLLYRIEDDDGAEAPSLWALLLYPADETNKYFRVGIMRAEGYKAYREMRTWFENSQEETICII